MMTNRRFAILLLTLGVLSAGWLAQSSSPAADAKLPPKGKPKAPKELNIEGEITANDAKDTQKTECYCKVYTFKMVKGATYQLDMRSTDLDSWLRLENPKGDKVAEDDDSGGNLDAQIIYEATETGDFKIIATTFNDGATGKFSLTVKQTKAPPGEKKEKDKKEKAGGTALKLKDGKGTFTGKLAAADGKFQDKVAKTFEVKLEEGKTYQIDLMSTDFDTYLFVLGSDGKVLAEDDDGGEGLNSRLMFKATKTGTYRLVASSFGGGDEGQFTLSVAEQ